MLRTDRYFSTKSAKKPVSARCATIDPCIIERIGQNLWKRASP